MLIGLQNVTFEFGARAIVTDATWHIQPGERIGLIGYNGTGKSTLLKLLVGQYTPSKGTVEKGRDTTIGYLHQDLLSFDTSETITEVALGAFERVKELEKEVEQKVTLTFKKGEFIGLNGKENLPEINIEKLNDIAAAYAIGRDIHVGDTIVGTKGRVGFEAAAALITIKAHHLLEKHTLTKWQLQHKEYLASFYGMHLHEGQYLDPVMRDTEAFLQSSQKMVSGNVVVSLKPYHFSLDGIISDHDLMSSKFSTYGEENKAWSADDAKGFIKILGNQNKIYQQVNS